MHTFLRSGLIAGLLVTFSAGLQVSNGIALDAPGSNAPITLLSLHIQGSHLVSAQGKLVELHGINLGGWLVTEDWMCGLTDSKDTVEADGEGGAVGRSALESLEKRFGPPRAAALMKVWQDHWITSSDLDQIRDAGFNLIRVPISYRTLQHADGSWMRDAQGRIDFARMDWIVREAAFRGMYTVFDLHVWPQQRSDYQKIGRPDGKTIRDAMLQFWSAIATHYKGDSAIAAFDLINEFPGNWGVQETLAHGVSQVDPARIQIIEGFTFPEFLRMYQAGRFPNSIFSDHFYAARPLTNKEVAARLDATRNSSVPVFIGEFLAADFAAATHQMDVAKVGWSSWTYKTVNMGGWGLFDYDADVTADIQNDTYQKINDRWSDDLVIWKVPMTVSNYYFNEDRRFATLSGSGRPSL